MWRRTFAGERQAGRPRIRGPVAGRGGGPFILPASTLLAGAGLRPFDPPQALARTGPAGAGKFLFPVQQSMLARSLKLGELQLEVTLLCLQHIFDIRLFLISNFEWRLTFCLLTASSGSAFTRPFGIAHSSVEFRKVFLGQQH